MADAFRRASHHSINKKVGKIKIVLSTQTLQVCTLSKVRLELLVKLFQSRLDLSVFDHGGKMRENAKKENFKTPSERQVTKSGLF